MKNKFKLLSALIMALLVTTSGPQPLMSITISANELPLSTTVMESTEVESPESIANSAIAQEMPIPEATTTPTTVPTAEPTAMLQPTPTPTSIPSTKATVTSEPTITPTAVPTAEPTTTPMPKTSVQATAEPTVTPTPTVSNDTLNIGGTSYTFDASGRWITETPKNGWENESEIWYFYENNTKANGWKFIGGIWYFFNSSGAMQTGWQSIGGVWYFFNSSGAMQTGWQSIGGVWYYFYNDGHMASNETVNIGGTNYSFDDSGVWVS